MFTIFLKVHIQFSILLNSNKPHDLVPDINGLFPCSVTETAWTAHPRSSDSPRDRGYCAQNFHTCEILNFQKLSRFLLFPFDLPSFWTVGLLYFHCSFGNKLSQFSVSYSRSKFKVWNTICFNESMNSILCIYCIMKLITIHVEITGINAYE